MNWIRVKDELPEFDIEVMVAFIQESRYVFDIYRLNEKVVKTKANELPDIRLNWISRNEYAVSNVLYWMPLPKPPKV